MEAVGGDALLVSTVMVLFELPFGRGGDAFTITDSCGRVSGVVDSAAVGADEVAVPVPAIAVGTGSGAVAVALGLGAGAGVDWSNENTGSIGIVTRLVTSLSVWPGCGIDKSEIANGGDAHDDGGDGVGGTVLAALVGRGDGETEAETDTLEHVEPPAPPLPLLLRKNALRPLAVPLPLPPLPPPTLTVVPGLGWE